MMNFSAGKRTRKTRISGGAQAPPARLVSSSKTEVTFFYPSNWSPIVDASSHFTCLTCQFKSCFHCRTPAHPNLTCMQNWINVRNQFFAADEPSGVWLRSYTKPCYCGRWIQKMEGCDHVKCPVSPVGCGGEWCWMCGAKYEEIRRVGNTAHKSDCPHYAWVERFFRLYYISCFLFVGIRFSRRRIIIYSAKGVTRHLLIKLFLLIDPIGITSGRISAVVGTRLDPIIWKTLIRNYPAWPNFLTLSAYYIFASIGNFLAF